MDVDNLWGKIGRYRSLSPVRKPLTGAVSATKSASTMQPLSRSRSRSKSPTRRERTRTTTNWGLRLAEELYKERAGLQEEQLSLTESTKLDL